MNRRTIAVALLLALAQPVLGQQDERSRAEAQAARAAARLTALHAEADRLAGEARTLLGDLRAREVERQIATEELRRVSAEATAAATDLRTLDTEMQRVSAEEQAALPALRQRLVELYKLGEGRYARLLLSASEARRAGQAARTVAMLAESDRARVDARRQQYEALVTTRQRLEIQERELATIRAAAARVQAQATRAVQRQDALIRQIDQRRDLTAQLAGELQTAQENLQITLQAMARGADATAPVLPLGPFRGDLDWPAAGTVRRRFRAAAGNTPAFSGMEIGASEGAPARAVHGGTVAYADTFTGFGHLVIVEHDGQNFTLYGHLLDLAVARGDRVETGDLLGSVGLSPAGQPGLYFEVRIDAVPVDPLQWLRPR